MQNKASGIKKYAVIVLFLVVCVLSIIFMGKVAINYNVSDYLDESTETKISLQIIEDEFGLTGDIQVMAEGVNVNTAKNIRDEIEGVENVLAVNFDELDENYYKDGKALFVVIVDGDEYSSVAATVLSDIEASLSEYSDQTSFGGTVVDKANLRSAIEGEIPFILLVAICLVTAIMLITSKSWLEPIVLLVASGVAILINMGTNVFFGEISYITNAVAAILQLALSIDYSIVLLHSYRAIKKTEEDRGMAMMKAIKEVAKPVSASALTTIAGLLALLFMSFKIGFDIGIVLMKGIVISALTSLTLLPALLLACDKIMSKTEKRELVLTGKRFCRLSFKASRAIVPIALALIIACGVLQFGNSYSFTDSKNTNGSISDTFGQNSTVIVVYPNGTSNYENENALADKLGAYKTEDGKSVLKNYSAYSNTVRELYDVELTARKLDLPQKDVEMLLTLYHISGDPSLVELKPVDFVKYAEYLIQNDEDTADFTDVETTKTICTLLLIDEVMNQENTAEKFHTMLTTGVMEGTELDLFAVKQMYGLYHYDVIAEKAVGFETMLDFMIAASQTDEFGDTFDAQTVTDLVALSQGIKQFNAQMDAPLTKQEFQGYMYQNFGAAIDDATAAQIWAGYYYALGQQAQETIPFLNLMSFLVAQNQITEPSAVATINGYRALYTAVHASYPYEQFLPVLSQTAKALSGETPSISATELSVQQIYIAYFYRQNQIPTDAILGRTFVDFVKDTVKVNPIVNAQLTADSRAKLDDMVVSDKFLGDTVTYDYIEMTEKLDALKENMQSISSAASLSDDKVSGIYVKYAIANAYDTCGAVEAVELLDFVSGNMDSHELLKVKMTDDNREKVEDAKEDIANATELFVGKNYSRMLLSIDLPSESEESSRFVEYLTAEVKEVFGNDAHIAGEMVSTYDLQESFYKDNTLISIFTIISIFVIVMAVFRSLSLPIVLVAVIQGAIWISMSTSLLTGPMFFMSYIVTTCILMGATIDYGILMSTNYVQYRQTLDKKEALYKSVEAAMPTVFTSGLILTVCGFVVGIISSQTSISTVGFLLGKGSLVSVLMITLVLPSVLYLLDGFILKLSMKKK